ncbi:MAG: Hsp33 family molecular chaperone HslO [Lachnospiraceae bacterium]|nr:Hsp33 family molecular chaperone HslO [Lachnospiraceae bacterium]MBR5376714.1 Hsp33 family molecular chaperone HslO [Lachnospiraceae bacterium]
MVTQDYMVRAAAADFHLRGFAVTSLQTVETARLAHGTSPVATAALGRLLSAGIMMGGMLKNEKDVLTLQVKGDGPIGGIVVTANSRGDVKGYVHNPVFEGYARADHKLDVGGAVGYGTLTVIKDMGLKEPFAGTTDLVTGEIGDDLTYYFAVSEQVPSSVGLGVLLNKEDGSVKRAGGFIVQVMPDAPDEAVDRLEQNLSSVKSVTALLDKGMSPEDIVQLLFEGLDPVIEEKSPCRFRCDCSMEKIERVIASLGKKELESMAAEGKDTEVCCHFCGKKYTVTPKRMNEILLSAGQ